MADLDLEKPEVQEMIKKAAEKMMAEQHEGLVKNRDVLLEEKRQLAERLKQFSDIDPDAVRELKKKQEEAEEERLRKEKDFDQLLKNQADKLRGEIESRDKNITTLRSQLSNEKIHAVAVNAISKHKGVPDLLLPHLKQRVRLDDEFNVEVLSREGTPLFTSKGERATVEDLVTEYKADPIFARAFDADVSSGGGARNSSNGANYSSGDNPFVKKEGEKNFDLKGATELFKQDPVKARALAKEAGVTLGGSE